MSSMPLRPVSVSYTHLDVYKRQGLVRFNLGHKTGIDFPGEMAGILRAPSPSIPLVTWANMGFGQGLTVTPVQLLACFVAIANKGIYTPLHYVKELVTEEGSFPPDIPCLLYTSRCV